MRIVIGADHAGSELKEIVSEYLRHLGHEVIDVGTHDEDPVDYPDYAEALSQIVLDGRAERGRSVGCREQNSGYSRWAVS